jgi:hypothetical protein
MEVRQFLKLLLGPVKKAGLPTPPLCPQVTSTKKSEFDVEALRWRDGFRPAILEQDRSMSIGRQNTKPLERRPCFARVIVQFVKLDPTVGIRRS